MATYQGVILDPFGTVTPRPVQMKGAGVPIDAFGFAVPRPVQKMSGYFFEPMVTQQGGGEINAPRQEPLEISWQEANPDTF